MVCRQLIVNWQTPAMRESERLDILDHFSPSGDIFDPISL